MPASAAITNGSLVSETSPSSMLTGKSCACAAGVATVTMTARKAPAKWRCMMDLPSNSCADTASAHRRARNPFARLTLSPTALRPMNATLSTNAHPTHAIIDSACPLVPGAVMKGPSLVTMNKRCAYCNEPFRVTDQGIEALSADNKLVCSEFCAQALREEAQLLQRRAS